jgi:hypothetical protein
MTSCEVLSSNVTLNLGREANLGFSKAIYYFPAGKMQKSCDNYVIYGYSAKFDIKFQFSIQQYVKVVLIG